MQYAGLLFLRFHFQAEGRKKKTLTNIYLQ